MTTATTRRQPEQAGQIVVVIGGSAGIGLETAGRARAEGADMALTGGSRNRLERAAAALGALGGVAFDAADPAALERSSGGLTAQTGHVVVTAAGPAVR